MRGAGCSQPKAPQVFSSVRSLNDDLLGSSVRVLEVPRLELGKVWGSRTLSNFLSFFLPFS